MLQSITPAPVFLKTSKNSEGSNYFINASKIQSIQASPLEMESIVQYTVKNSFGEEEKKEALVDNFEIEKKLGLDVLA